MRHGGSIIAETLQQHDVEFIFTLCGGHISPILVACREKGIRVIDVRHEATAVFAADAMARLSGNVGIAAVTAGPGLTNTITAIKNAQMAQVPVLILGGATATILKGRGSLQDIDHLALVKSITKLAVSIKRVKDIQPTLEEAILTANSCLPGPVYVEIPVDILYSENLVREWYGLKSDSRSMPWWLIRYINWNVNRIFKDKNKKLLKSDYVESIKPASIYIEKIRKLISDSQKPIMLIGSQAMKTPEQMESLSEAVEILNIPTFVSGMARGLLSNPELPIYRHARKQSLLDADLVILAGVPCDFRLDYGRHIKKETTIVSINLSRGDLYLNRKPTQGILEDPSPFIINLSQISGQNDWASWHKILKDRNQQRNNEIEALSKEKTKFINPLKICMAINQYIQDGDIIVADGGDFVATASYILRPRSLSGWLDPGVFGTLGVGAGFILGAQLVHSEAVIWAIYGDGAFGYSLMEFDTFVRHKIPVIAIIGNDAGWTQIARDQVEIFKDPVATELGYTNYHEVIDKLGGVGYEISENDDINDVIIEAKKNAKLGKSVLINVKIGKTDFRKGSISV